MGLNTGVTDIFTLYGCENFSEALLFFQTSKYSTACAFSIGF
jgi:hypothetical protein